jgi:hypothetical protein
LATNARRSWDVAALQNRLWRENRQQHRDASDKPAPPRFDFIPPLFYPAAMKIIRCTDANFSQRLAGVTTASSLFDAGIEASTRAILHEVFVRGDAAIL